jgi:hypothetical protein
VSECPGAWLSLLPQGSGRGPRKASFPTWTVSRVLFRGDFHLRSEDHSSRRRVATPLERSHPDTARRNAVRSSGPLSTVSLFELAPGGACLAAGHPAVARGLLPHDFNLTCAAQVRSTRETIESLRTPRWSAIGGVISVALSLGSPRVGVTDFPALWSPDFPPADGQCPPAILHPPPAIRYPSSAFDGERSDSKFPRILRGVGVMRLDRSRRAVQRVHGVSVAFGRLDWV